MDEPVATPERPATWRLAVKVAGIAILAALVALLLWATLVSGEGRSLVAKIAAGEAPAAPGFELEVIWPTLATWPADLEPALRDGTLSLDELRGRPAVLNFWASWCIPCRDEAPILNASSNVHQGEVVFVGIDVQDLRGDALAFLREFDVPYVAIRDRADETYRAYGLTGVPETYYLDAEGRIVAHSPGAISGSSVEAGIARAMAGNGDQR